ncbi:MAG: hypothetical protein NUV63_12670 [Gallionella sp.]|nr:hypothetical protein [Gallionella sp.]
MSKASKVILSLAGLLAAVAFAPEASAVPSFARQTGMACSACHQQHFPVLSKFGQSFKAGGYTMMGAQAKVEGEHLTLPDTLNASMLLKARYQKENGTDTAGTFSGETNNGGQWQFPDEFSLFFGGRIAENVGFLFEGNTNATALLAGFKMPFVFDAGSSKLMAIPYMTDALGASYGFEQASTGAVRGVRWAEHRGDISAQQYIGTDGAATGVAFVAMNDMGYINFSRWSPNFTAAAGTAAIQLKSKYLRVAATPTVGDWPMHIGVQSWSGSNLVDGAGTLGLGGTYGFYDTKATAVDFQAQGQAGGKDLSLYATWAKAPVVAVVVDGTQGNLFNAAAKEIKAFTLGADYSVVPSTLHIGAAYRNAKNGAATNDGDNSVTLTAVYDLAMNVAFHLNHSKRSGSAYNAGGATSLTTLMLEAAW